MIPRCFLGLCVALIVVGFFLPAMSAVARPWTIMVCPPNGPCAPYSIDMVPHRYQEKTACDIDVIQVQVPSGWRTKCERDK